MLSILKHISEFIQHLVKRQDVKLFAWHSDITKDGMHNIIIVWTNNSDSYEVWKHDTTKGFQYVLNRHNTLDPEELFGLSLQNHRYNIQPYILICGIPQTGLERDELFMRVEDYINSLYKVGLFTSVESVWSTENVRDKPSFAGGDIFLSGMPFFAKTKNGWAWTSGSPIKRTGIITRTMEET